MEFLKALVGGKDKINSLGIPLQVALLMNASFILF